MLFSIHRARLLDEETTSTHMHIVEILFAFHWAYGTMICVYQCNIVSFLKFFFCLGNVIAKTRR